MKSKIYLFVFAAFLMACDGDKDEAKPTVYGTMTFAISGVSNDYQIDYSELSVYKVKDSKGDHQQFFMGMSGKDEHSSMNFSVSFFDWQNPPKDGVPVREYSFDWQTTDGQECTDDGGACDGASVTYKINDKEFWVDFDRLEGSYARITKCDTENMVISGEFLVNVKEVDGTEIQTLKGSFTDMKYKIADPIPQ